MPDRCAVKTIPLSTLCAPSTTTPHATPAWSTLPVAVQPGGGVWRASSWRAGALSLFARWSQSCGAAPARPWWVCCGVPLAAAWHLHVPHACLPAAHNCSGQPPQPTGVFSRRDPLLLLTTHRPPPPLPKNRLRSCSGAWTPSCRETSSTCGTASTKRGSATARSSTTSEWGDVKQPRAGA